MHNSAAYLITTEDIDAITQLIESNLQQDEAQNCEDISGLSVTSSEQASPAADNKNHFSSTIHSGDAKWMSTTNASGTTTQKVKDYLEAHGTGSKKAEYSRADSSPSEHEVIWEGRGFHTSMTGSDECDRSKPPQASGYFQHRSLLRIGKDKGDAFDPGNPRASISEWSWRLPQSKVQASHADIPVVVASSDSEPNVASLSDHASLPPAPHSTRGWHRKTRKSLSAAQRPRAPTVKDVVSFPPLPPRKATDDWYSPLPGIETSSQVSPSANTLSPPDRPASALKNSRSLYNLGLDINLGPDQSDSSNNSGATTLKATKMPWAYSVSQSPRRPSDIESIVVFDSRRKSVLKAHPKAAASTARLGAPFAMGSAIGAHSKERRKSAAPVNEVKRVRTVDNTRKGEGKSLWTPKWRQPSVCPPRRPPTPTEQSAMAEHNPAVQSLTQPPPKFEKTRTGLAGRMGLLKEKSPPSPKVDCVGIYGSITGTHGRDRGRSSAEEPCWNHSEGSRNCVPHTCGDCSKDPMADSRTPSVDWIG